MEKAIGMRIFGGILSPRAPKMGTMIMHRKAETRITYWYKSFDLASVMMPLSTKLVIQSTKKFEKSTEISLMIETPKKQTIYLESLQHSTQTCFRISRKPSDGTYC